MKKIFLFAIVALTITVTSCSNKGVSDNVSATDSSATVIEDVKEITSSDSIVTDSSDIVDEVAISQVSAN